METEPNYPRLITKRKSERLRRLMHSVLPSMVSAPEPIVPGRLRDGDRKIFISSDGKKHSWRVVPSAEPVRYAYTETPLPLPPADLAQSIEEEMPPLPPAA